MSGVKIRCQAGVASITYPPTGSSKFDYPKGYFYNFSHCQSIVGYRGEEEEKLHVKRGRLKVIGVKVRCQAGVDFRTAASAKPGLAVIPWRVGGPYFAIIYPRPTHGLLIT